MTGPRATSRRASRWLAVTALAVVAVLGALSLTEASATRLTVTATKGVVDAASRCTSSPVTVTTSTSGTQSQAVIGGLTSADVAACGGRTVTLRLVDGNGSVTTSTAQPGTTITLPITVAASAVQGALVDVGGFALPTTLSYTPPTAPFTCTVVDNNRKPIAGQTCKVTKVEWLAPWNAGGGRRAAEIRFHVDGPSLANGHMLVTGDLRNADNAVAGWRWPGTITSYNNMTFTSPVSQLPVLTAYSTNPWWASGSYMGLQITEAAP